MTITEFLLARIAEDEEIARGATVEPVGSGRTWFDGWSDTHPVGMHIGRWAPARVLAECEAKRRILERAGAFQEPSDESAVWDRWDQGWAAAMEGVLKILALTDADHPDYDESWLDGRGGVRMMSTTAYTTTYIEERSAPSQAAGLTEDGRPFYFRSRHGEWTLEVGQVGVEPYDYSGGPLTYPGAGGECYGPELVAWGEHEEYPSEETIRAVLDEHLGVRMMKRQMSESERVPSRLVTKVPEHARPGDLLMLAALDEHGHRWEQVGYIDRDGNIELKGETVDEPTGRVFVLNAEPEYDT